MTGVVQPADIGIIVLAAGSGVRFGSDKRQAMMSNGKTVLENTLDSIPPSLTQRTLVLKPEDQALADRFNSQWQISFAHDPASGMANSLASGIAMARGWRGALIGLGDMPWIRPDTYTSLQEALSHHAIVIPAVGERRGNPVGFRQEYFDEISNLEGDQGARKLLEKYAGDCFVQETGDEGIFRDIDKPEGLG